MTIDFINTLHKPLTEKVYQDISLFVDINLVATKNGLKTVIPIMLASILGNNTKSVSSEPAWWNAFDNETSKDDDIVDSSKIINAKFIAKGRKIVSDIFKSNYTELNAAVSSVAGIQKDKSDKLIEVTVPLLALQLKRLTQQKKWNYKDLIEHLIENKQNIIEALPVGVSPKSIGLKNTLEDISSEVIDDGESTSKKNKRKKNNGLLWFGGLVVLAIVLWYFMGSRSCTRSMNTEDLLVPEVSNTIISKPTYEKVKDGTYYANEIKPKIIMMKQK